MRSVRFLLTLAMLTLLVSTFAPTNAEGNKPNPVGQRPDAPTYALHGPYWVGTQTLEMDAGTKDYLRFTIWYPALNPEGLPESVVYTMSKNHLLRTMIPSTEPFTVLGHALADALPDKSGAPYPLVISSHGFTAQMWQMYLGEHLASYGFVVIAPDHANDSWANLYTSIVIRFLEVKRVIRDVETLTAPNGTLAGMIDVERIAVGGHSAGGMTSYGAAGSPLNWSTVVDYCQELPDDLACNDLDGQHKQILDLLGTDTGTDGLLPAVWDTRVDAIFPMAGTVEMHGQQGLKAITIPMMTLFGSSDAGMPWFIPAYEDVSSAQKSQVVFKDAGHGIFQNQCEAFPYIVQYDLYWACSDAVWDIARTQDLTNHFTTAFMLDVLNGDKEAHKALLPDAVQFAGIEYKTTIK